MNKAENKQRKAASSRLGRGFYILVGGSFASMLGDQFTLVALPWLVLKLTGSAVALGTVLAVMAVPRAAFMLIGGAVVDRLSPLRVLILARAVNALLIAVLAALVWSGGIRLWMLYVLALGIGTATAFVYPAGSAILPQIVRADTLAAANSITMALRQLSMFVGPGVAGAVIAAFAGGQRMHSGAVPGADGIATAFTIDAISFAASIGTLITIRDQVLETPRSAMPMRRVFHSIAEGAHFVWRDFPLRAFMLYVAAIAVFVAGPLQVGLPVLADDRLDWGAASYGVLMSANGGGALLGALLAGAGVRFAGGRLGLLVLVSDSGVGMLLVALGFAHITLAGAAILLVSGTMNGFIQVAMVTWIQRRVAPEMMGRAMSLLMFAFLGLGPLSAAVGGAVLAQIGVTRLFVGAGVLLSAIALLSMLNPGIRMIRAEAKRSPPSAA